jgi:hypothetical protein|nr:MAG TPA: hypothetical protein [Caudoviricetes sp.]
MKIQLGFEIIRGSGYYALKYPNGILEIVAYFERAVSFYQSGNLYRGDVIEDIKFPIPFVNLPNVTVTTLSSEDYVYCAVCGVIRDMNSIKRITVQKGTAGNGNVSFHYRAIGFWK